MKFRNSLPIIFLIVIFSAFHGCDLDVTNPNTATEDQVVESREALQALVVGLQQFYANEVLEAARLTPGTTANEVSVNSTLANLLEIDEGGNNIQTNNANILQVWSRPYRAIGMAETILEHAEELEPDPETRSGMIVTALWLKAASLGVVAQSFEEGALTTNVDENVSFTERNELFEEAISLLEDALEQMQDVPPGTDFESTILGPETNLENTILALLARYNLYNGNHQQAFDYAGMVDPEVASYFSYDNDNPNPIWNLSSNGNLNYYGPIEEFGTPLFEEEDNRYEFYITETGEESATGKPVGAYAGFFGSQSQSIPTYLWGEMLLIRAEAQLNLEGSEEAISYINEVRSKTAEDDPYGVGAELPEYTGDTDEESIREEIYRQRAAELFLTGLRFEDSRRLGRPGPMDENPERNRNFYPYPDQERQNNPNVPADPEI